MLSLYQMPLLLFALLLALLQTQTKALSSSPSSPQPNPRAASASTTTTYPFQSFQFDKSTGICRNPSSFRYSSSESCKGNNNQSSPTTNDDNNKDDQFFVLRNVPGAGDCIFHAVLSSVFISMGFMNPDATFAKSDNLVSSMALEMRHVVANYLSSPDGVLYVNNKPVKRIVRCQDLLSSAAKTEGLSRDEYLTRLRQPGKLGGLYGGGPELTVLSNILRRPISIYHLKQQQQHHIMSTSNKNTTTHCELERMGVFGEGLFEDQCQSIPDSVISNAVFFTVTDGTQQTKSGLSSTSISTPLKSSWHLHVLIADAGENEKHASVLLPSVSILHNDPKEK
jgi:hypothetical protein